MTHNSYIPKCSITTTTIGVTDGCIGDNPRISNKSQNIAPHVFLTPLISVNMVGGMPYMGEEHTEGKEAVEQTAQHI